MQISDTMTEVKNRLSVKDAQNLATKARAKRRTVHVTAELDCLQSPIFSLSGRDRAVTVTDVHAFKCTEGVGPGVCSGGRRGRGEINGGFLYFSRLLPNQPPLPK